jgi:5S rRNA maturation endonuclease (ribonuclease M5)
MSNRSHGVQTLAITEKLRDFIDSSGLRPRTSQASYIFDCPRCGKAEKLYMFSDSGRFVCWVCNDTSGFRGKPEYALTELTGQPIQKIRKALYGTTSPTVEAFFDFELTNWFSDDETFDDIPEIDKLPTVFWGPGCYPIDHPMARIGANYLESRGISLEVAKSYGIYYNGAKMRVLFPIQYKGNLYGWQGRAVGVTEYTDPETGKVSRIPKALTAPEGLKKERLVCFADQMTGSDQVIISEGPIDAIKMRLCSPDGIMPAGNVATLGKGVSQAQINLIKYSGASRVYLALDPDAASSTERLIKEFSPYMEVYVMEVPKPYEDFGEMTAEDVRTVYLKTKPVIPGQMYLYLDPSDALLKKRPQRRF